MSTDRAVDLLFYGLILLLPLSALLARRIPLGQTVRMALIWIAIFGTAFLIFAQRDRLAGLLPGRASPDGVVRIAMAPDGHFWADVRVNGVARHMLVDSGATTTALSVETAKAAGVALDESPFGTMVDTANGRVMADHASIAQLRVGPIVLDDVGAIVSPSFGRQDVIGMNVLRRLRSWRVERGELILNDKP
ncbi:retropepsin-like aspartic protease family protein [Sphingomonas sp. Leaf21]|uniref:retropepsin-like aspartic protease family protein n=1 Tax=Sphingomonas sp. Leaf21 TaxID=2876550 RepID=UPI001E56D7E1|nr:TIGR02281 family clan AA aspartic protease [Sphingomonas sp. Leaf21]